MNKKSIDKIDIFTLDVNYKSFMFDIFKLHNLDEFMNNLNNELTDSKNKSINLYNRLLEYCWYVYMDEIIINKTKFIDFYVKILKEIYNITTTNDKFEKLYNESIKNYVKEKNNINYHKIILESI
jgi:hypothetical protein